MLLYPKSLSLIVTHRCTASCDHCCFDCSPEKTDTIPEENILRYIDQATEVESLRVVVFTGGECFLLGDGLDRAVKRATDHGFSTRFVSNGYWATSKARAESRLQKLVSVGLKEANFSTGDMHAKFVRPEYVRNGAIASARFGLTTLIMVELFQDSAFDLEKFVAEDREFQKMVEDGSIILNPSVWMPFSGKSTINYSEEFKTLSKTMPNRGCTTIFNVIAINPHEDLITCCGLTQEEIPELHIGNLREKTIKQILDETVDDFLKMWIHLEGPQAVIDYARGFDDSIPPGDIYAHICHACRVLYNDVRVRKAIMHNPPVFKMDIVRRYYDSVLLKRNEEFKTTGGDVNLEGLLNFKAKSSVSNARQLVSTMRMQGPKCCTN